MLTLSSPAKVNLFLRILGKRSDGYHALASLFHTIDLADTLTLSLSKEDVLTCTDPSIGPNLARISHHLSDNSPTLSPHLVPQQGGSVLHEHCPHPAVNQSAATGERFVQRSGEKYGLVTTAVDLFRRKTGLSFHVSIHLEKKIPTQAGLGGGSSNAATTLKGLNELLNFPVSTEELQHWSAEIGSDVPFFFSSGTAYCTGRGEIVRDVPRFAGKCEIYKPEAGLSTPAVYKALNLDECSKKDPEELLEGFLSGKPIFLNDLERPAFRLMPELEQIKKKHGATMSGSGTAFFIFQFD